LFAKSAIPALFRRHATGFDPVPFLAAAHIFPMRVNDHVAKDLTDW
jgi:hypothetical protein